jgi:hypothetical protein
VSEPKVTLRVSDIIKICEWVKQFEESDPDVEIIVSHSSGIGPSIEVSVETKTGEGLWKDFTDYENW